MIETWEIRVWKTICDHCGKVGYSQRNQSPCKSTSDGIYIPPPDCNAPEMKIEQFGEFKEEADVVTPSGWLIVGGMMGSGDIKAVYCNQDCMEAAQLLKEEKED